MNHIGIMQGRLVPPEGNRFQSFPRTRWRDEFGLAAKAGLACIEWIDDTYGEDMNPLRTAEGLAEIRAAIAESGVRVQSVCADTFMERPLIRCSNSERTVRLELLRHLLRQCAELRITHLMLPFVDNSAMRTPEDLDQAAAAIADVVKTVEDTNVQLHLETSLNPVQQSAFLTRIGHPLVRVTYDTGNSASLGFDPREEFAAYGQFIGSVHVKDRLLNAGTVPLGQGNADLRTVFGALKRMAYDGTFILQVARGVDGDEVAWAVLNRETVLRFLSQ